MQVTTFHPKLSVLQHPIAAYHLAVLRDYQTPAPAFRNALAQLATLLFLEASADLPTVSRSVETPLQLANVPVLDGEISVVLVPILRAGLLMTESALALLPQATVHHLGLYRDETSLKPVAYYDKLKHSATPRHCARVFLLDPMLATGGSALAAIETLRGHGFEQIKLLSVLAAPEGLSALAKCYPQIPVYTAAVDEKLNERGFILPGLGDAGDRAFGT